MASFPMEADVKSHTKYTLIAAALFLALIAFEQWRKAEPFDVLHLMGDVFEWALLAGAVGMAAFTSAQTRDFRLERLELMGDLAAAQREGARWRSAVSVQVSGLSRAIATQFQTWSLTDAEADVAGLLIKGLSQREIAALRDCSEATVRQHATMVYRKSGLSNRAQLTAFFLEDLLADSSAQTVPRREFAGG